MENSNLKSRILSEIERIISSGDAKQKMSEKVEAFYKAIIQKHYNATDVNIDYHRHRVKMNVIVDDSLYQPKTANVNLPVLPVNLFFLSLSSFLKSCIDHDDKSLAIYAKLLSSLKKKTPQKLLVH